MQQIVTIPQGVKKITRNGVNIFLEPNSPNKEKIIRGDFDKALERMKKGYKENSKIQSKATPLVTQGNASGIFEFTATSINNVAVSKSTSIYIK